MNNAKRGDGLADVCAIILAGAITLIVRGYQFGQSNHTVYLLDALRVNDRSLFTNDWFVTHTYQYHFIFTYLAALLDRLHILRPGFVVGYLLLIVAWQAAWLFLVKLLGGNRRGFLVAVILFFLSASGFGLGFYDFLQDSAMLPSNIANVLMLSGIVLWIGGRNIAPAVLLGAAGLIHLNDAVLCVGLWLVLVGWERIRSTGRSCPRWHLTWSTLIVPALCLVNIIPAFAATHAQSNRMPLDTFVSLYVRLRHPHHYDPSSWPAGLWISFFWPFPFAVVWWFLTPATPASQQTVRVLLFFCVVMIISLLGAGLWYISETLIQMSLSRFSIYPKLFTCTFATLLLCRFLRSPIIGWITGILGVAGGILLLHTTGLTPLLHRNEHCLGFLLVMFALGAVYEFYDRRESRRTLVMLGVSIETIALLATAWRNQAVGFQAIAPLVDPPSYVQLCEFAKTHTPVDAIFLVPPEEESFRLVAQRAIVINFKGVPQLDGELVEWRDRLCIVLDWPTLRNLPHRFDTTLKAIGERYASLADAQLIQVARSFDARYIVVPHPLRSLGSSHLLFENGHFYLYDLQGS